MILLRFSGTAIQEDVSEEKLGHHDFLSLLQCAGSVCLLTRLVQGPGSHCARSQRVSVCSPHHGPQVGLLVLELGIGLTC